MFEFESRPIRCLAVAVCVAFLAGCGSQTDATGSATTSSSSQPNNTVQPASQSPPPASVPGAPTGVVATAGNALVSLTWTTSAAATGYHVKRATTSGGSYSQIAAPAAGAYTDSSAANGTTYYYVVSAVNSAGESANSAQVSATPAAPSAPPSSAPSSPPPSSAPTVATPPAPTSVRAGAGNAQANLTWSASSGATSYDVKRATVSGGPYSQVATPTSTNYTDSSLINGTTYYYVVSAVNSGGASANSAQVSVVPAAPASSPPPTAFGTWANVTPSSVDLTDSLDCGNYGTEAVQQDPMHPSNLYTSFNCQGIWKSTDYGVTWTGPINTGTNGAQVGDCAGGITIPAASTASVPTIYLSCIRGNALGFWKSVDGGIDWTNYFVAPSGSSRQDYYPPTVDPHDPNHLLMAGHEMDYLVESVDGGQTWTNVSMASGMLENGGTGAIFFINTGNATTTRGNWLWMAQQSGGVYGTWRTTNNGATWVQVDLNEHAHGIEQIYQPDANGVVYMVGAYSALGWGVLRSTDYGQTWSHVGQTLNEAVVFGTTKNVYSMFGYPVGIGGTNDPSFEIAAQPGTGTWTMPGTPAGLNQGAGQICVINDGTHNIFVGAMWNNGVWRYIEP